MVAVVGAGVVELLLDVVGAGSLRAAEHDTAPSPSKPGLQTHALALVLPTGDVALAAQRSQCVAADTLE